MKAHLRGLSLWQWVEEDIQIPPLGNNPMLNQIRAQEEEEEAKAPKALSQIYAAISETIFTRIMTCETAKQAWHTLKENFQGSERTRQMQVLNLRREFELLRMKKTESIKDYSDRLLTIVNKIRLTGEELPDSRIVEKVLVSLPERFEAKISSLEDSRNLSQISLSELMNALQAQEQRRGYRQETVTEGALQAMDKRQSQSSSKNKKGWSKKERSGSNEDGDKGKFEPCIHCKKTTHQTWRCWFRPNVVCRACNQKGHVEKVCKNKQKGEQKAQVVDQPWEEQLFVATCFAGNNSSEMWLIDSGCTRHMSNDKSIFKELDESYISKFRIGNGDCIDVKGK